MQSDDDSMCQITTVNDYMLLDSDEEDNHCLHAMVDEANLAQELANIRELDTYKLGVSRDIEAMIFSALVQLNDSLSPDGNTCGDPSNKSKCRKASKPRVALQLANRKKAMDDESISNRAISYPQRCKGASAKPLAQLLRILDIIHVALTDGIPVTKRDIYYQDVALFKGQAVVDRKIVDDLAATFEVGRADLNVRATSKGLVCGAGLVIHLAHGETIHVNDSEGTLIPAGEDISTFEVNSALSWVLIVEKDAVFQTLCKLRFACHSSIPGRGMIITGKGYPDVATRQLVKTLSDNLPSQSVKIIPQLFNLKSDSFLNSVPILALVDGDPYGLDILSVYKFGSIAMRYERYNLAAQRVEWLGIRSSELESLAVERDVLIPITPHDQKKALSMLRRPDSVMPQSWRKELMHMLHSRRKAEIEILSTAKLLSNSQFPSQASSERPRCRTDIEDVVPEPVIIRYLADRMSSFTHV